MLFYPNSIHQVINHQSSSSDLVPSSSSYPWPSPPPTAIQVNEDTGEECKQSSFLLSEKKRTSSENLPIIFT
jgi:hypothetical protein